MTIEDLYAEDGFEDPTQLTRRGLLAKSGLAAAGVTMLGAPSAAFAGTARTNATTKVAITGVGGWENSVLLALTGTDLDEKAALVERSVHRYIDAVDGLDAVAIDALMPDGVELEHSDGGQPSWWWLLAAE